MTPVSASFLSCCLRFTLRESKAQRDCVIFPKPHSGEAKDLGACLKKSQGPGRGGALIGIFLSLSFFLSWLILIYLLVSVFTTFVNVRFP